VRRLIAKAKALAEALGKKVVLWLSDRQDAFVTGIAAEFPGTPHRYCVNHFLRDVAKPVLEADSHAKVEMRQKVRGLRKIEQAVLKRQKDEALADAASAEAASADTVAAASAAVAACAVAEVASASSVASPPAAVEPTASADSVVLDYCTTVRGILNDDQGGPLQPPGLRMADALREVRASIQRNLAEKKGASPKGNSTVWPAASIAVSTPSVPNKRNCAAT
jgi:hypothetical protein